MPNGQLDQSFISVPGFNVSVTSLHLQTDGKILASGFFNDHSGNIAGGLARLNSNGTYDNQFNVISANLFGAQHVTQQSDGNIILSGSFEFHQGIPRNCIARVLGGAITTGISSPIDLNNELSIYPIPAFNGEFTILIKEVATFQILDLKGYVVNAGTLEVGENTFNLRHLPKAMYLIVVNTSKRSATSKLLIE
jgi:hypothetical protein